MNKQEYEILLKQYREDPKHKRKPKPVKTEEGYQTKALNYGNP